MKKLLLLAALLVPCVAQAKILVPMDDRQTDHLKAYGLAYWSLVHGARIDWLLNYRGGSFLMPEDASIDREAKIRGVATEGVDAAGEAAVLVERDDANVRECLRQRADGPVGGAVVHDDDEERPVGRRLQRAEAGESVLAAVPSQDHDADPWGHASSRR